MLRMPGTAIISWLEAWVNGGPLISLVLGDQTRGFAKPAAEISARLVYTRRGGRHGRMRFFEL
jgi:hypothetical protein